MKFAIILAMTGMSKPQTAKHYKWPIMHASRKYYGHSHMHYDTTAYVRLLTIIRILI